MRQIVDVEVAEGIATVTIDNPPVNALTESTLEALGRAAAGLARDQAVRAVVLTGAGTKAFAAGADLHELGDALGDRAAMRRHVTITRSVFDAWAGLEQPVVAAVTADAVGGGLELALVCDLIVADPGARLGLPEVTLGLIPGAGGTQRLPRRVGMPLASRLLMLGTLLEASAAHEAGLVDLVAAPGAAFEEARHLAARLAALPPAAVRAAKGATRMALDCPLHEGLDVERDLFVDVALTRDAGEGVAAFLERRPARFQHQRAS